MRGQYTSMSKSFYRPRNPELGRRLFEALEDAEIESLHVEGECKTMRGKTLHAIARMLDASDLPSKPDPEADRESYAPGYIPTNGNKDQLTCFDAILNMTMSAEGGNRGPPLKPKEYCEFYANLSVIVGGWLEPKEGGSLWAAYLLTDEGKEGQRQAAEERESRLAEMRQIRLQSHLSVEEFAARERAQWLEIRKAWARYPKARDEAKRDRLIADFMAMEPGRLQGEEKKE